MSLPIPKRERGGLTQSHRRAGQQEAKLANKLGGRVTKQSGAGRFQKGDVRIKGLVMVEAKHTKHRSFSVTAETIDKIEKQATMSSGELPVIHVEIEGGAREVYVVPAWVMETLLEMAKDGAAE